MDTVMMEWEESDANEYTADNLPTRLHDSIMGNDIVVEIDRGLNAATAEIVD